MGSKAKGSAFEREVSRYITKWMSGQTTQLWVWRAHNSGAMGTTRGVISEAGDIHALVPEAAWFCDMFTLECKKGYAEASFDLVLKNNKSDPLRAFWKQACDAAKLGNKIPMLIVSRTRIPTWVSIPLGTAERLGLMKLNYPSLILKYSSEHDLPVMFAMDMEEFFKEVTPEKMKETFKN